MEMIKKFLNKVLILNMVITSAVALSVFSVIYFVIYSNINFEIQDKLEQAPGAYSELNRVGSVTLIAIFLVTLYFADRTIKPLADAWQKQKQFAADASHELILIFNKHSDKYGKLW